MRTESIEFHVSNESESFRVFYFRKKPGWKANLYRNKQIFNQLVAESIPVYSRPSMKSAERIVKNYLAQKSLL